MFHVWFIFKKNCFTDDNNYLQNFIYSFLFLLNGMPDNDNVGADVLSSGKG
jgi:hypothetical protein